jgi:dTDP-4-dehydrorhamnose reductase
MRAIVVGVDGLVGSALFAELRSRGVDVLGTTRRRERTIDGDVFFLDLANPQPNSLPSADVVFICAAMTRFAECRAWPQLAERIVCGAPEALSASSKFRDARIVLLSTSAVMDCKEPLMRADRFRGGTSVYGRYKAEAERRILASGRSRVVVRLTKVLVPGQTLLQDWIAALRAEQVVEAFEDHRIAPIAVRDAVEGLIGIGIRGSEGIYQISGASDVSYREIASHIAIRLGVGPDRVRGCSAAERGIPFDEILSFTSLDSSRLTDLSGFRPPDPYDVIDSTLHFDS